jgi:hypothetical protein
MEEGRWYVGRVEGAIVSTALGPTIEGSAGILQCCNPQRPPGARTTATVNSRALRDGVDAGSGFGYLQSSSFGHGVYQRLGFRDVEEYILLTRPPQS